MTKFVYEFELRIWIPFKMQKHIGCVALPDTNSEKIFYTNSAKNFLLKIA